MDLVKGYKDKGALWVVSEIHLSLFRQKAGDNMDFFLCNVNNSSAFDQSIVREE